MIDPSIAASIDLAIKEDDLGWVLSTTYCSLRVVDHKANPFESNMFKSSGPSRIASLRFENSPLSPKNQATPDKEQEYFDNVSGFVLAAFKEVEKRVIHRERHPIDALITPAPFIGFEITAYGSESMSPIFSSLQQLGFRRFTEDDYQKFLIENNYPHTSGQGLGVHHYYLPWKPQPKSLSTS